MNIKSITHRFVAASFLLALIVGGHTAEIQIKVYGYDWPATSIYVLDGTWAWYYPANYIDEFEETIGEPPDTETRLYKLFVGTIPDAVLAENRGIAFHLPGLGTTEFNPISNFAGSYEILITGEAGQFPEYNHPSQNPSGAGNQLLLGHWWGSSLPVAILNTWDNENPHWPAVGIDMVASHKNAFWRWMLPNDTATAEVSAMELDYKHRLTLPKRGVPTQAITLDPELGRITINNSAVLTVASASTQFVARDASGVNLGMGPGSYRSQAGLPPQLLLGAPNDTRTNGDNGTDHTQGVMIVGSAANPGRNGLRILDDGRVLIWDTPDLPMHADFKKGPTP